MKKLPNGIVTNKTVFLGVDWSRSKIDVYDGENWTDYVSLIQVAEAFPNSMLFLEATAESFELQKRKSVVEAFEKHNVEAYCFPSHWTAMYRKEHSILKDADGTGKADAQAIRSLCLSSPRTLCRFKELTVDPMGEKIGQILVYDRYADDGKQTFKMAQQYIEDYPPELEEFIKGSDKKYRKQIGRFVAVALQVRKAGKGFREFRRQVGNYAQGYARMTRSEFYWWWTRTITKSRLKRAGETVRANKEEAWWMRMTDKQQQIHRDVLKQADKTLKYIWRATEKA